MAVCVRLYGLHGSKQKTCFWGRSPYVGDTYMCSIFVGKQAGQTKKSLGSLREEGEIIHTIILFADYSSTDVRKVDQQHATRVYVKKAGHSSIASARASCVLDADVLKQRHPANNTTHGQKNANHHSCKRYVYATLPLNTITYQ